MADEAYTAQTVLIIDDDLGFVWWLGDILSEAGCRVLPALSCDQAPAVTEALGLEPDIIVLNPNLLGAAGIARDYVQAKPHSKIVTIGPPPKAFSESFRVHATLERPSPSEHLVRREWLAKLRKLLTQVEAAKAG